MKSLAPGARVLLLFPRLPASYWDMRYLCEQRGAKCLAPPLGLLTVAALLPPDWQLRLVDENVQSLTEADWQWGEVVLLSAMLVQKARLHELVLEARARGKTVVVGGPYPTIVPEEMLAAGAHLVVRGELENLVTPFLAALQAGDQRQVLESREKPDLSTSPVPRFDLVRQSDYVTLSLQTSRGCPFDCEFCDVVALFGHKVRHKSPAQVLAELEEVYRLGWRQGIFITDDNFIGNPAYARELLKQLIPWMKSHGEPFEFWTQASVNLGQDPDLIDLMTEANISHVFIGIESPDEEVLRSTHKYHNVKSPMLDSVRRIGQRGLTVVGSFILGFDDEEKGAGERIAAFVEAANIPQVMLNLLTPLPNTRLWRRLKEEGRLLENTPGDSWREITAAGGAPFRFARPEEEVLGEFLSLWDRLFDRAHFLARAYRYYRAMRPTRAALGLKPAKLASPPGPRKQISFRDKLKDLRRFLSLSWRQGVRPSCRRQYWVQLFGMLKHNPTRVIRYLNTCAAGEDMFLFREKVRQLLLPRVTRGRL